MENTDLIDITLIEIITTSKSSVWSPNNVTKTGLPLTWIASAIGMVDQIVITNGSPTFNLSVARNSDVTITAISSDGSIGFQELAVNSLNIISLNISNAENLLSLSCTDNQLTKIDVTKNTQLIEFFCHSNQINELAITNNKELTILACFFNSISILDLSQNLLLSKLSCSNNLITSLDLSKNTGLITLECDSNRLENLNIQNSNNSIIEVFKTTENLNLFCIQVDDVNYSELNWKDIDSWTNYNKDCTFTNEPPIALNDFYDTDENKNLIIDSVNGVLANDTDPDDDELIAILTSDSSHGELELNIDGSFSYAPDPNFYGVDSFFYMASDGALESNIAEVTIEVNLVNEAPIAVDDNYITMQNIELLVIPENGILNNDMDADGDDLTALLENDVSYGSLILLEDGSFSYTPYLDFNGTDIFSYKAFDGLEYSNIAVVTIIVEPKNDIIVPNAFTPNGDNINDTFRPVYVGMNNVQLSVYNTWGNLIYTEEGQELGGWDGMVNNNQAENGNYLYKITAETNKSEKIYLEGLFSLIK